jgi:hypothetical protein
MLKDVYRSNRNIIGAYIRSIYPTLTSQKVFIKGVKDGIKGTLSPEHMYIEIPRPPPSPEPKAPEVPLRTFPQGRKVKFIRWLGL